MPETLTRSHKLTALFLIVALGLVLRLRGLGQAGFNEDEVHKVQAARAYLHGDLSANLEHPMLMKSLIAMSLAAADSWKIAELSLLAFIAFGSVLPSAAASVEVKRNGDRIDVLIGGHPFTAYYFGAAAAKPYLFPLRSAQGTVVTRGFPMDPNIPGEDQDEPHQRTMYFAHGDINGYDFWGEVEFPRWSRHSASTFGRTVFRKLDDMQGGPGSGALRAEFDLVTSEGQVIAAETQAYTFTGDEHSRIVDCEFTVRATHGPVKMGDTKEGTFAIRLVKALDSPPGRMVNSEGAVGEKAVWGKRADWVDHYGNVAGEDVGIAIFWIIPRTCAIQPTGTPAITAFWLPVLSA